MGLLISADVARLLAVTLNGRELGRWWVPEEVDDADVLDELGIALVGDRAPRPAACGHAQLPGDLADAVRLVNDLGDEHVEGGANRAVFFGAVATMRSHWCTHATPPDSGAVDESGVDESAGNAPAADHGGPSSQVDEPDPVDESAEDPPSAAQPIESPAVSVKPPVTDTTAAPVAVSGTPEPQRVGEATAGAATDATVRRWALAHDIPCSTTGGLKAWVREAYERVDGKVPDFDARRRARAAGAQATTPSVRPEVAGGDTIATWCLRNGVEDRGGRVTVLGRQAYAEAWRAAHPVEKPPAAVEAPTGEDPPAPDERAGQAAPSGAGVVNGRRLPDFPSDSSSDDGTHYAGDGCDPPHPDPGPAAPAIEPVGDGGQRDVGAAGMSRESALARAEDLLEQKQTPRQVADATGLELAEVRDLERALRVPKGGRR